MTIIIILIAFFCDKYPQAEKFKKHHWLNDYADMMMRILPAKEGRAPWWGLFAIVLPLLFVVFIIQLIGYELWFGLAGFIFGLLVLIYSLGASRIGIYFMELVAKRSEKPVTVDTEQAEENASFIVNVHQEIFAIVFWFLLLGAVGAVLYRALLVFKKQAEAEGSALNRYHQEIQYALSVMNWPSVRVLSLCLSLGGAFTKAFPVWWQGLLGGLSGSQQLLEDCAKAAADKTERVEIEGLFYRSVLIFLVILALMTLASWIS